MLCPQCRFDNRANVSFCEECGTRLDLTCPSCGAAIPPGRKFCGTCGKPLAAQPVPEARFASPEVYTPKHLAEQDPEEARKILDPVLELMMEAVHRYEGTVNQVMGDGIMALFGAPLAHEDHAVRACHAALRMQDAIRDYAEDLQRTQGVSVLVRVGVNSGEVVVRAIGSDLRMDYTAVGQTTHLAARMEQMARPGTAYLTEATMKLVEGLVEAEALGAATVKGLRRPVDIYRLVAIKPGRSRLSTRAARGLSRFVGRGDELQQLDRARERMVLGEGQLVAVVGEPGVGKSRLFWEFTRSYCHPHHLVLEAGSVSHGKATPFLPLTDLLSAYFAIERRDDREHVQERIVERLSALDEALVSLHTPLRSLFPGFAAGEDWLALDARERRRRTLDACRRLLLRESQLQPLVIVFEDLHWIDSETQAFLDHLVEEFATAPILILVNYRPEYECGWTRKEQCSELLLEPLAPPPAAELLDSLLGHDERLLPLKRLVIERTEGNPFFLEETVRGLVEAGRLRGATAHHSLDASRLDMTVPATVHAVLGARIDRLPPDEKELLQAASAIGKEVSFALLQAIADRSNDELQRGLARLHAAGFIYEARSLPEPELSFKHALTHEVTYRSLVRSTKQRYHERIARNLISRFPTIAETRPELVAHHLSETEAAAEALTWWERAGKRATDRSAHLDALGYYRRALA